MPLHACETVKAYIRKQRQDNVSWAEISAELANIPPGSLYSWAITEDRPLRDEYKKRLGLREHPPRQQFGWLLSFWSTKDWAKEIKR